MFPMIVYIIISAFTLLFAIYHFCGNRELYQKTSHIRGPIAFPLIGSAHLFIGDSSHLLHQLTKLCNTYASPCRITLGPTVAVLIHDIEHIKTVFLSSETTEKIEIYDFIKPWLNNGIVTAPRSIWRLHRKLIQPAFASKILISFVKIFQRTSILLTEELAVEVDRPEFEVYPYISFTSFRNLCESSLGMPVTTKTKEIEQYLEASQRVFEVLVLRVFTWFHLDIIFNMSQTSKMFYDAIKYLKSFTVNVIQKRRIYLKSESFQTKDEYQKKPFLDLLLAMSDKGHFTDEEIREHSDTMIVAGYDTVARTNCFTLLMLASHPEIQDKVYEELYQIYGRESPEENPVKFEDLKHMEYLERVIKEVMRLFPAVPILGRKLLEDFSLDGYTLPKGCGIVLAVFELHRSEKYWPNPLKFDPDRFLPERIEKQTPHAFMPFSLGPRDCIGRVYAMISMKILMATLLRKYVLIKDKITPDEDIKVKADVLLSTVEPVIMRIEKRVK